METLLFAPLTYETTDPQRLPDVAKFTQPEMAKRQKSWGATHPRAMSFILVIPVFRT